MGGGEFCVFFFSETKCLKIFLMPLTIFVLASFTLFSGPTETLCCWLHDHVFKGHYLNQMGLFREHSCSGPSEAKFEGERVIL